MAKIYLTEAQLDVLLKKMINEEVDPGDPESMIGGVLVFRSKIDKKQYILHIDDVEYDEKAYAFRFYDNGMSNMSMNILIDAQDLERLAYRPYICNAKLIFSETPNYDDEQNFQTFLNKEPEEPVDREPILGTVKFNEGHRDIIANKR